MITTFIGLAFIIGILGFILKVTEPSKEKPAKYYSSDKPREERKYYKVKEGFFTRSEYQFFTELNKQNQGNYYVLSKVRLEDIVEVVPGLDRKVRFGKRNVIKSRHIDFVLVDKLTGKVAHAIELDGYSHNNRKQQESDRKKNKILKQCGVNLHRIRVGQNFIEQVEKLYK